MIQPHIQCKKVSKMVLLPGDPKRVDKVGEFLENPKLISHNREFRTIIGTYKEIEVTVTSTGIGGASAVIALEELISSGGQYFIRIGSCGAVQESIKIGDLILAMASVREDGASSMYIDKNYPAVSDFDILSKLQRKADELKFPHHVGVIRSHDSFYIDDEVERMNYYNKKNILGSDMETASLFVVGRIRGVKVGSILNNVVLYNKNLKDGVNDYINEESLSQEGEKREIILALETLREIHKSL